MKESNYLFYTVCKTKSINKIHKFINVDVDCNDIMMNFFRKRFFKTAKTFISQQRWYKRDVTLIGVPFSGGQPKSGVEQGPGALRNAGIVDRIEALGRKVNDVGDIEIPSYSSENPVIEYHNGHAVKNSRVCGKVSHNVAEAVEKGAKQGDICVTIGGDHRVDREQLHIIISSNIATGSIYGHQKARGNICVLWIDAHNDLNTYQTSPSGNMHGMCLSFLLKGLPYASDLPGYEWAQPCLSPFDVAYIGLRDTDPGEYTLTQELGIITFSMHEVDRYGISTVVERAIESINPRLDRPIHVSYDIDSLDPSVSPSTGTAVYGGLSFREGLYIGEHVNKLGILGALDLVEVNPRLGLTEQCSQLTIQTALRITGACLGFYNVDIRYVKRTEHFIFNPLMMVDWRYPKNIISTAL